MSIPHVDPIRILIIDDHKIVRDGLRDLVESRPALTVVGDAGNSADALTLATREKPDVIVLDLDLGTESGLDLLPQLLEVAADASIIVLTGIRQPEIRDKAMELGAKGMLLKDQGASNLLDAIEKVHRTGEYWVEPGALQRIFEKRRVPGSEKNEDPEAAKIAKLTPTERELITYIGEGISNKEIANKMFIAESTVRNNLTRIYDKLEISGGRLGLLVYALRHALIKNSP
jgi:DNA-binding NarL/FixJ family response regulator